MLVPGTGAVAGSTTGAKPSCDEGGLRDVGAGDDNLGEVRGLIDPARGFTGEVVGLAVEDAEAGPDDRRIGELVGEAQTRREVVQVLLAAAVAAILGALERLIARIARSHAVELGDEPADSERPHRDTVRKVWRLKQLPAHAGIHGQSRIDLPVVEKVKAPIGRDGVFAELIPDCSLAGPSQQHVGQAVAGRGPAGGVVGSLGRIHLAERELASPEALRLTENVQAPELHSGLQRVPASLDQQVVIDLIVVHVIRVGPEAAGTDLVVSGRRKPGHPVVQPVVEGIPRSALDAILGVQVLRYQNVEPGRVMCVSKP